MKKIFLTLAASVLFLASCDEWDPVFTLDYGEATQVAPTKLQANTTIAELKAMYQKSPIKIDKDIIIAGQVTTSDETGNFYRSFYIQDETSGIEVKIGSSYLYNEYKEGQWVYIKCSGLTLGKYGGMVQLGYQDPSGSYETAYIDVQYIIDTHIFKGEKAEKVKPIEIGASDISLTSSYLGMLVKIPGCVYGNEVFTIIYDTNSNSSNSVYLSGKNVYGLNTWAFSQDGCRKYLENGGFGGRFTPEKYWQFGVEKTRYVSSSYPGAYYEPAAESVSQYFKKDKVDVQVRTSGYSNFADTQIDSRILAGQKVTLTGILSIYNSNIQFTINDIEGGVVVE